MERITTLKLGLLIAGLALSLPALALNGQAAAGQAASAICTACHQPDGNGMNIPGGESWPRLAGLNAKYIYKQLQDFKAGSRTSPTMTPFATMLTDQQMRDLAVYYSQMQPGKAANAGASAELLAQGEKLATYGDWDRYLVPCASCHGPNNQGAGAHFPGIAGQHAGYIESQLLSWQQQERKNDPQQLMLAIAERMTPEDIKAVAAWLATQPAQGQSAANTAAR